MREEGEARALVMRAQRQAAERTALRWSVVRRRDATVVGTCTLFAFDEQNQHAEIGYALGREHWGQGYMHEALVAVVDWAFRDLRLHRIEADVDPRNAPSVRALERLGFVREGLLRERWHVAGEVSDSLLLGLLRRDWRGPAPDPPR